MSTYTSATEWIRAIRKDLKDGPVKDINERVSRAVGKGYIAGVTASPVCTGYLRASWRVTLNSPARAAAKKSKSCDPKSRVDLHTTLYSTNRSRSFASLKRFDITRHSSIFVANTAAYVGEIDKRYSLMQKVHSTIDSNI